MPSAYSKIYNYYLKQIKTDILKVGDKIPTEFELMKKFNVSRITVMRALNELKKDGYVIRERRKGTFVTENTKRRQKKSNLIALIVSYKEDINSGFIDGAESVLKKNGYFLAINTARNDSEIEKKLLLSLKESSEGVISYPINNGCNISIYSQLVNEDFPIVFIDTTFPEVPIAFVTSDNEKSFKELTKHLINLGHKRIGFVGSDSKSIYSTFERYKGYCNALIESRVNIQNELIYDHFISNDLLTEQYHDRSKELHLEAGRRAIDYFFSLESPPTAIMAVNDTTAIFIEKAALERGIKIPEQLSITGFDNIKISDLVEIPITTVNQDFNKLGKKAAELLIKQISGIKSNKKIEVESQIILRDSVSSFNNKN